MVGVNFCYCVLNSLNEVHAKLNLIPIFWMVLLFFVIVPQIHPWRAPNWLLTSIPRDHQIGGVSFTLKPWKKWQTLIKVRKRNKIFLSVVVKIRKTIFFSYKLVDGNDDEVVFSHRGRIFYQSFFNHQLFRPPNCGEFCQIILESLFFMNH